MFAKMTRGQNKRLQNIEMNSAKNLLVWDNDVCQLSRKMKKYSESKFLLCKYWKYKSEKCISAENAKIYICKNIMWIVKKNPEKVTIATSDNAMLQKVYIKTKHMW